MSLNSLGLSADLSGQIALVTGASQGLGQTVAVRLGENGAKVLCIARNADKLAETVSQIQADRKSTRLNSSHLRLSRMPSSA